MLSAVARAETVRVHTVVLTLTWAVLAAPPPPGSTPGDPMPREVPEFSAASGDEALLTRAQVRGKVLLAWYEGDGVQEVNAALKAELKTFNTTQLAHPERLVVVPFADVSGMIWPITAVARSKLRDISAEIGLTVYGDWDGTVRQRFRFVEGAPNVLLADASGVIRWRYTGKVPASEFPKIKALIAQLVDGEARQ